MTIASSAARRADLLFLLDENVAEAVVPVLDGAGYSVLRVRDIMARDEPDHAVASVALEKGAILVSHDRDFQAISARPRFRLLHLLWLNCREFEAADRLAAELEHIRVEMEEVAAGRMARLNVAMRSNSLILKR